MTMMSSSARRLDGEPNVDEMLREGVCGLAGPPLMPEPVSVRMLAMDRWARLGAAEDDIL